MTYRPYGAFEIDHTSREKAGDQGLGALSSLSIDLNFQFGGTYFEHLESESGGYGG